MSILKQTYFLLKKNFQIKKRHKRLTFQEIIVPIYWLAILVIIKKTTKVNVQPAINSDEIPTQAVAAQSMPPGGNSTSNSTMPLIGIVTDNDPLCEQVFSVVRNVTEARTNYKRFKTSEEMVNFYKEHGESTKMGLGFVFKKDKQYGVSYTIRAAEGILPKPSEKFVDAGRCFILCYIARNIFCVFECFDKLSKLTTQPFQMTQSRAATGSR